MVQVQDTAIESKSESETLPVTDNKADVSGTQKPTGVESNVTGEQSTGSVQEPETFTKDYVQKIRDEAAAHRVKANQYESDLKATRDRLTALEREQMSEGERIKAELEEMRTTKLPTLEQQNRELRVEVLASKHNVHDADLVTRLLDWKTLDLNDPAGIEAAVVALLEQRPYLKKTTATDSTANTATESTTPAGNSPTTKTSAANPGKGTFRGTIDVPQGRYCENVQTGYPCTVRNRGFPEGIAGRPHRVTDWGA